MTVPETFLIPIETGRDDHRARLTTSKKLRRRGDVSGSRAKEREGMLLALVAPLNLQPERPNGRFVVDLLTLRA